MNRTAVVKKVQIFGALQKYPDFRYLWVSSLFFFGGNWMQVLLIGWLAYELTGSPFLLALATTARLLPFILGPVGGLLADRMNRVKLLLYLLALNLALTLVLLLLVLLDRLEFWHLAAIGFGLGLTMSPSMPARFTLIMDIVGKEDVSNAVSVNAIAMDVTRVVGPAAGGLMLAYLGPAVTLGISSLGFAVAGALLFPIIGAGRGTTPVSRGSPLRDLVEGFRIVLGNRDMAAVLSISLISNIFVWPIFQTFMPVFAKDVLGLGADGLGFLLTSMGIGALVAAVYIASLGDFNWKGQLYVWGTAAFGLFFALFALSTWFPLSILFIGLVGFASSAFSVMQAALMLILAPEEFRARAMGVQMLAIGILPLATIVQGAIAEVIGVPLTTVFAGSLLALSMVALFFWVPTLRRLR